MNEGDGRAAKYETRTGWLESLGQEEWAGEGSCTEILKNKEAELIGLRSSSQETGYEMEE